MEMFPSAFLFDIVALDFSIFLFPCMNYISFVKQLYQSYPQLKEIVVALHEVGALPILVGGAVRDFFLKCETKDFDVEVYHISHDRLKQILARFGPVDMVGASFGVLKLHVLPIDWSLPRQDTAGRKPQVIVDQYLSFYEAFIRRDLTINAMGINLVSGELVDPFNGKKDLENKILRAPDGHFFVQDPLRFFRVMQFIGRFEMQSDERLNEICRNMEISAVSRERISAEFEKLLLLSKTPSLGFRWLVAIGRLAELIPELDALRFVQQKPLYHPEGDVFEHTMQTLDAAARIAGMYKEKKMKLVLLFAALCHDIGKKGGENEHGHDFQGALLVPHILSKITIVKEYTIPVQKLVRYHMAPLLLVKQESSVAAYKRLASSLAPEINLAILADLALADRQGRNSEKQEPLLMHIQDVELFKQRANEAFVFQSAEPPLLRGNDIMDMVIPGRAMGELLKYAYEVQIEEGIRDKELLKARLHAQLEKRREK